MGENKHITELDTFAKKYVSELKEEEVPVDFTKNVMHSVLQVTPAYDFKTKNPLISKVGWFFIAIIFTSALYVAFKDKTSLGILDLPKLEFSLTESLQIEAFSISLVTVYAFLFFGLMLFIQIYLLNNYFSKRIH